MGPFVMRAIPYRTTYFIVKTERHSDSRELASILEIVPFAVLFAVRYRPVQRRYVRGALDNSAANRLERKL